MRPRTSSFSGGRMSENTGESSNGRNRMKLKRALIFIIFARTVLSVIAWFLCGRR